MGDFVDWIFSAGKQQLQSNNDPRNARELTTTEMKQLACDHRNATVRGTEMMSWCTCDDCGMELPLQTWFNSTMVRMSKALKQMEQANATREISKQEGSGPEHRGGASSGQANGPSGGHSPVRQAPGGRQGPSEA